MSDNYSHIDNLLKSQLGHDRQEGTPDQRAAFMKKAASHRFWNFYPAAFNVYYLALIIVLIGGIVFISTTVLNDKVALYDPLDSVKELPELPELPDKQQIILPVSKQENSEKKQHTSEKKSHPATTQNNKLSSSDNESDVERQEIPQRHAEQTGNTADYDSSTNEIQHEMVTEPLPVVYDTVVKETRVQVTDTLNEEVKQTIKVQKKDNKRRRR